MTDIYKDGNAPVARRVADLMSRMTLEEKVAQLGSVWVYELLTDKRPDADKLSAHLGAGIGHVTRVGGASDVAPKDYIDIANRIQRHLTEETRLGIPAVVHEECCSGLMTRGATLFPQAVGLASSWDPELIESVAGVIRRQARRVGAHHALAPVLDVTRDPRWGRTEETFGEDPYLVARLGCAYIEGLQGTDWSERIIATAKHFVGYGASEGGMNWAPPHIPPRELRDVYLFPFEAAVRESGIRSVMNAYNELDGLPCGANRHLLTEVLRTQWGFEGTVVSDYFAVEMLRVYHLIARDKQEAARLALEAGIDVELPSRDCYGDPVLEAARSGAIPMELIDAAVERLLRQKFLLGLFERPYVEPAGDSVLFDTERDRAIARRAATRSIVMLKNENRLLPLENAYSRIAVIGPNADSTRNMMGDYAYPCHIEAMQDMKTAFETAGPEDEVSVDTEPVPVVTTAEALRERLAPGVSVTTAEGCDVSDVSRTDFETAERIARESDVAVCVLGDRSGLVEGCTSGEARDRASLLLPGAQQELLERVVATGTPTVLVLVCARPMDLRFAAQEVPAILLAWLPGEEGGNAVADVLLGETAPGGKLPISFPRSVGQVPAYHGHKPSGGRSHWLGRYVEMDTSPLYPFGYGLTYGNVAVEQTAVDRAVLHPGERLTVTCRLRNTGTRAGEEVVQLYVRDLHSHVTRPVRELKGFRRVGLAPGAAVEVAITVSTYQLGFTDADMRHVLEPGEFELMIATSARDIVATHTVEVVGTVHDIAACRSYFSESVEREA